MLAIANEFRLVTSLYILVQRLIVVQKMYRNTLITQDGEQEGEDTYQAVINSGTSLKSYYSGQNYRSIIILYWISLSLSGFNQV